MRKKITVLFCQEDSIYKSFPVCDVWDEKRNALNFNELIPIIAHPPCRKFSRMRGLSTAPEVEKELAYFAAHHIKKYGGILEHPAFSILWKEANLPNPGEIDKFGGFTLVISQFWFGHKADKLTWLYIVGLKEGDLPPIPFALGEPLFTCSLSHVERPAKPEIPKRERSATPRKFAEWLIETVQRIEAAQRQKGKVLRLVS